MTALDPLTVRQGAAPLSVSLPHTGTVLPPEVEARVVSPWLARKAADWWIDRLYAFAADLDATIVHTAISRAAIDVNRDRAVSWTVEGPEATPPDPGVQ
jgi:formiminoglutamase